MNQLRAGRDRGKVDELIIYYGGQIAYVHTGATVAVSLFRTTEGLLVHVQMIDQGGEIRNIYPVTSATIDIIRPAFCN